MAFLGSTKNIILVLVVIVGVCVHKSETKPWLSDVTNFVPTPFCIAKRILQYFDLKVTSCASADDDIEDADQWHGELTKIIKETCVCSGFDCQCCVKDKCASMKFSAQPFKITIKVSMNNITISESKYSSKNLPPLCHTFFPPLKGGIYSLFIDDNKNLDACVNGGLCAFDRWNIKLTCVSIGPAGIRIGDFTPDSNNTIIL